MAETVRRSPDLQEVTADQETPRDGSGTRRISFFWGPWLKKKVL